MKGVMRIESGILLFYKAGSNELIYKCKKRETAGVSPTGQETEKPDFVASNSIRYRFAEYDVIDEFVERLSEAEPRYKTYSLTGSLRLRIFTLRNK